MSAELMVNFPRELTLALFLRSGHNQLTYAVPLTSYVNLMRNFIQETSKVALILLQNLMP